MADHAANRGEKIVGNASSVKRRPDGRVYISGQMQRHVLFSAMDRLNDNHNKTYVANGDGLSTNIAKDLRSDLGGYMDTTKGEYSGRRTSPISVTPAVALKESKVGNDLLIRLKMNVDKEKKEQDKDEGKKPIKQAFVINEFSQQDEMLMNFHLDVGAVGVVKTHTYEDNYHIKSTYRNHIDDKEHARRVKLFLEATESMTDYANQARNAVSGEFNRVLIVLDNRHSRKAMRYFQDTTTDAQRVKILEELKERGATYFLGSDADDDTMSVSQAFNEAKTALGERTAYRPDYVDANEAES